MVGPIGRVTEHSASFYQQVLPTLVSKVILILSEKSYQVILISYRVISIVGYDDIEGYDDVGSDIHGEYLQSGFNQFIDE